jgi:uncharacterized OB-fold protein
MRDQIITRGRPLPLPTLDTEPFYAACRRGELRFQRCTQCGLWRHYPRPACPECLGREFEWALASGTGEIYTWTIVHPPTLPAFEADVPYNVVDVLLDEGVHFQSQVLDCPPDQIHAGMRVVATFVSVDDEITLVKFRRAEPVEPQENP